MRFNQRATFVNTGKERYNPDLGEYVVEKGEEVILPCFTMDLGIEKSMMIFGDYQKGRKKLFIKRPMIIDFTYIVYDGKTYKGIADKQSATVFYLEVDNSVLSIED